MAVKSDSELCSVENSGAELSILMAGGADIAERMERLGELAGEGKGLLLERLLSGGVMAVTVLPRKLPEVHNNSTIG